MRTLQLDDYADSAEAESPVERNGVSLRVIVMIVAVAFAALLVTMRIFTPEQGLIVQPLLAACTVLAIFSYVLNVRTRAGLFGELGFLYLALALAYTIVPGVAFLASDFAFPVFGDGQTVIDLAPKPQDLGAHFWRHALFVSGVAVGYLALRGGALQSRQRPERSEGRLGTMIAVWTAIVGCSIVVITEMSAPVETYVENYTRFAHLGWFSLRFVYVCLILKEGGYFILLSLMFRDYRKYRTLILITVPLLCVYETVYSFGSRIGALTILLTFICLYHYKVSAISLRRGAGYLIALAVLFTGVGAFRAANFSLEDAQQTVALEGGVRIAEFGAVYGTSFHLFGEREQRTLPPRPWPMFFYEFIAVVPFVDHTQYNPQYWYARNYFPAALVPPQTTGVIADSAIWGGELDLLVRSLINGALFALLTRWFLRRRNEWFAGTVYVFLYATCVMTLKYSVLYQLIPAVDILLPTLLVYAILSRLMGSRGRALSVG